MYPHTSRMLGSLHHYVKIWLKGRPKKWQVDGIWMNPLLAAAITEAGLEEVEMYVTRHQIIVAKFIMNKPIIDLFLVEERHLGVWVLHQWREREVLEGMRPKTN